MCNQSFNMSFFIKSDDQEFLFYFSEDLHQTIEDLYPLKKTLKYEYEDGTFYKIYTRFYEWLIEKDVHGINLDFDRELIRAIYIDYFWRGYQEFKEKFTNIFTHGNTAIIANLKPLYEGREVWDNELPVKDLRTHKLFHLDRKTSQSVAFKFGWLCGLEELTKAHPGDFRNFFSEEEQFYPTSTFPARKVKLTEESKPLLKDFELRHQISLEVNSQRFEWCRKNNHIAMDYPKHYWDAFFSNTQLPDDWEPIPWILLGKSGRGAGKPNLTKLGAILLNEFDISATEQQGLKMKGFFIDAKGNPLIPLVNLSKNRLKEHLPFIFKKTIT